VTAYCDKAVTSTVTKCVPSKVHAILSILVGGYELYATMSFEKFVVRVNLPNDDYYWTKIETRGILHLNGNSSSATFLNCKRLYKIRDGVVR